MFLTPRTVLRNRTKLRLRLFACASILTLLVTQMVLPGKAVVFAAIKANAAPVSAPPEPFAISSGSGFRVPGFEFAGGFVSSANAETGLLTRVPSFTGMIATLETSLTSAFRPELARSFTLAFPPAAAPAAFPAPPAPAATVSFDFDGDGKADIGRWAFVEYGV